jgi:hypothetical protein
VADISFFDQIPQSSRLLGVSVSILTHSAQKSHENVLFYFEFIHPCDKVKYAVTRPDPNA